MESSDSLTQRNAGLCLAMTHPLLVDAGYQVPVGLDAAEHGLHVGVPGGDVLALGKAAVLQILLGRIECRPQHVQSYRYIPQSDLKQRKVTVC